MSTHALYIYNFIQVPPTPKLKILHEALQSMLYNYISVDCSAQRHTHVGFEMEPMSSVLLPNSIHSHTPEDKRTVVHVCTFGTENLLGQAPLINKHKS